MTLWTRLSESRWARLGVQAAVVLIVVALLVAGAWAWYRAQEARGLAALAAASALLPSDGQPVTPEARDKAIKALESVLAEYPRLSAAPQAAYELGKLKYLSGRYEEARTFYATSLARGATGTTAALAALGIGYSWEAEKDYIKAASAYEEALKRQSSKDFLFEEALMAEARAQELAGKPRVALDLYQRLLREVPDSRRAEDLRSRLATLQSRVTQ